MRECKPHQEPFHTNAIIDNYPPAIMKDSPSHQNATKINERSNKNHGLSQHRRQTHPQITRSHANLILVASSYDGENLAWFHFRQIHFKHQRKFKPQYPS
jgi:uncharacterized protein YprB with RNaseH-like and TPR domain